MPAVPREAERKAREMVAVAEYLCTHQRDVARTPLLLDRLSFNVEQCLMDGAKTSFGALVFGRLPLYTLVCESPGVVAAEHRDALQRMVALATKIGTNAIGRVRVFIRLLLNNRAIVPWLAALLHAPSFLEFAHVTPPTHPMPCMPLTHVRRTYYLEMALMRSVPCAALFVGAMETVLGAFKFSYPLTDRNLNMDQLWEVYTAVFDVPIAAPEHAADGAAPAFGHVAHAQALLAAARAAAHWHALPAAATCAQRLLLARAGHRLPALAAATSCATALLRAHRAAPQHAALVAAARASRTAAADAAAALLRAAATQRAHAAVERAAAAAQALVRAPQACAHRHALDSAARDTAALLAAHTVARTHGRRVAGADAAAALLRARHTGAVHAAVRAAAAQTQALARAQTERVLHALAALCAAWCGDLLAGARVRGLFVRAVRAAAAAQGVWRAARTQRAQRALVAATEHVQAALAEARRARTAERARQRRLEAECARLRSEQRAALENDELAHLVRPHTRPQWVADRDAAKCKVCCQPFSSSNRRVCTFLPLFFICCRLCLSFCRVSLLSLLPP